MAAFMNVLRKKKVYAPRRECAESQYKQLYRFEEGNVEWMADHFLEHSGERRGGALTAKQQLQVLLRYVGDPGFQVGARVHYMDICTFSNNRNTCICQRIFNH